MKNMSRFLVPLAAIALLVPAASAQPVKALLDSARQEVDLAVDRDDQQLLKQARSRLERVASSSPNDPWVHHYIGYTYYREGVMRLQKEGKPPRDLLDLARKSFERSIAINPIPESHALLSAVIGQSIGTNPLRGMTLGPKSDAEMDKAVAAGPRNPRVWLLRGIGTLHKPGAFGGGADKAEAHLKKAAELFQADSPEGPAPRWGHAETYAWLGQIEVRRKNPAGARAYYTKALEVDPAYGWVKFVLLPSLDRPAR